jgi:hypothetical protein
LEEERLRILHMLIDGRTEPVSHESRILNLNAERVSREEVKASMELRFARSTQRLGFKLVLRLGGLEAT